MKLLDRFRKKPYRSLDRLAPDELSAFSVVAYFECSAEDIRAACKQLGNDCTFVAEPSPRMLLSCPQPTWTATLWESGKALCTSVLSFEDATACARWLRNAVLPQGGCAGRTVGLAEVRDGEAHVKPRTLVDLQLVCRAENHEIAQALVGLFEQTVDVDLLREELTVVGLASVIETFEIDNEESLLVGVVVKPYVKDVLLARLRTCSASDLTRRTGHPETLRRWKESKFVRMTALIAGQITLGVLGNAVFQYVVVPLIKRFGVTHKVEIASRTQNADDSRFTESVVVGLLEQGAQTLDAMAATAGLPVWRVLIEINLLRRHQVVRERDGMWHLLDARGKGRVFMETEFHAQDGQAMKLDHYSDVLEGLINSSD